eukprot:TRINITY_DN96024_c0_g1_i1.p1 TRINITY_DN96024_c0_g1~~TRINITY_DN96024_c0_g1_i1.p1  ORF type:complete len:193 (+),score=12.28 TRINITY_DN96024_c0_g1_i1:55-579(+)
MKMVQRRLWCDLDGVLTNFDKRVAELFNGKRMADIPLKQFWGTVATVEPGFYSSLEWMPDGAELWNKIKGQQPTILTGLPRGKWAEPQKRQWCSLNLGPDIPVVCCMARDKYRHCIPGDVLIDDSERLKADWEAAGGTFILHTSTQQTLLELQNLGILPQKEPELPMYPGTTDL